MRFIPLTQVALAVLLSFAFSVAATEMSVAEAEKKITKLWAKPVPAVGLKLDAREQSEIANFVLDLIATDDPLKDALEASIRLRALTVPRMMMDDHLSDHLPAKPPTAVMRELAEMAGIFLNRAIEHSKQGEDVETTVALADFVRILIQARVLATVTLGDRHEIFTQVNQRNLILFALTAPVTVVLTLFSIVNHRAETFELMGISALVTSVITLLVYGDRELAASGAHRPLIVLPTTINRNRRKASAELFEMFHAHLDKKTDWVPPKGFLPEQIRAACALYLES